jgi:hypothetical protein
MFGVRVCGCCSTVYVVTSVGVVRCACCNQCVCGCCARVLGISLALMVGSPLAPTQTPVRRDTTVARKYVDPVLASFSSSSQSVSFEEEFAMVAVAENFLFSDSSSPILF